MKQHQLTPGTKIFCTGAFLQPVKVEINGMKQWRWILVGSENPSYYDGEEISIYDYANDLQGLLQAE